MLDSRIVWLTITLPFLCRTLANTAEWGALASNLKPIIDFSLRERDEHNIRKQNTEPWIKKGIVATTYSGYLKSKLETWVLNEHAIITPHTALQYVLFWSNGGGTGDLLPFITLSEEFADLGIPNARYILYEKYLGERFDVDGNMGINDLSELLKLDIIPLFVVILQDRDDFLFDSSNIWTYYKRLNKISPNEYSLDLGHSRPKRIVFLECFWFSESTAASSRDAYDLIQEDQRNINDVLGLYQDTAMTSNEESHRTDNWFMEIRSGPIELMNSEDLMNSPSIILPTIKTKDEHFSDDFPTSEYRAGYRIWKNERE